MSEPETITTLSSEAFEETCRRIRAEELHCESISQGRSNGEWIFKLWKPIPRQAELIPTCERGGIPESNKEPQETTAG